MVIRKTENYVWNDLEKLGEGTFGQVCRGADRKTGQNVAVKKFKEVSKVSLNEFEMLKKVDHQNIVKVLAIENELGDRGDESTVVVMELCTGGSMDKILYDPENTFGLPEDEFLNFLLHLCGGISYLRENNILHRDLKPGNILRYIGDDDESVYKIADFDAARELSDNETFESIKGTELYLDPYIYERAILHRLPGVNKFPASTDLWSIGATLYHVVTGMLPFRPFRYKGRYDPQIYHDMCTKKQPGVISAYQLLKKDELPTYDKTLPEHCLLSPAIKELLCPLLADLMEADHTKKTTYYEFFQKVKDISSRKKVHVFFVNRAEERRIYLENSNLTHFQNELERFTNVKVSNQILLIKDYILKDYTGDNSTIPDTTEENPIYLWDSENFEINFEKPKVFEKQNFPNTPDIERDYAIAKHNCSVAHSYKRLIDEMMRRFQLIQLYITSLNQVVVKQLIAVSKENQQINTTVQSLSNQLEMMRELNEICKSFLGMVPSRVISSRGLDNLPANLEASYEEAIKEFQMLKKKLDTLQPSVDALVGSRVDQSNLLEEWRNRYEAVPNITKFQKFEKASASVLKRIRSSFWNLHGIKVKKDLRKLPSSNDVDEDMIHMMERAKLIGKMSSLEKYFNECQTTFKTYVLQFSDWFKSAQAAFIQPNIFVKDLCNIKASLLSCEKKLNESFQDYKSKLSGFSSGISLLQYKQKRARKQDVQKLISLNQQLLELKNVHLEIFTSLEINKDLCAQLQNVLNIE